MEQDEDAQRSGQCTTQSAAPAQPTLCTTGAATPATPDQVTVPLIPIPWPRTEQLTLFTEGRNFSCQKVLFEKMAE